MMCSTNLSYLKLADFSSDLALDYGCPCPPLRIISYQICTHFLKLLLFSHNALYPEPKHPILLNFPQKAETRVEHLIRYLYEQMSETLIKTDKSKRELQLLVTEKPQAYF